MLFYLHVSMMQLTKLQNLMINMKWKITKFYNWLQFL